MLGKCTVSQDPELLQASYLSLPSPGPSSVFEDYEKYLNQADVFQGKVYTSQNVPYLSSVNQTNNEDWISR